MDTPEQLFADLAIEFNLEDRVRNWLTAKHGLNAKSLDEFLHAATVRREVAAMADAAAPRNRMLATLHLQQAWLALKRTKEDNETRRLRA
eukprot:7612588-Heterocapsa_arctica.AAC.1